MSQAAALTPSTPMSRKDGIVPLVVVAVLGLLVLPIPPALLDLLLAFNIAASIAILLTSMHIQKPLDFSVFPALLLVTTLLRLGLNVSTTRLILIEGSKGTSAAGHVVETFGKFVVGGSFVVGIVVFLILLVINFVVITKGSGRIAEVAARFNLDAMPGKQMSIDAELAAGAITQDVAKRRREELSQEMDFHGAMDGANKFVRGDAVAALIITAVNILGGLVVGVAEHGMSFGDAGRTYTILTIGDGLVSQIPALIISTASGLIVTRNSDSRGLGTQVVSQTLGNPKVLDAATGVIIAMAFIPGLPLIPFLGLAGSMQLLKRAAAGAAAKLDSGSKPNERASMTPDQIREQEETDLKNILPVEPLELQVGYGLVPMVTRDRGGGELLDRIVALRKRFAQDLGILVPPVALRDSLDMQAGDYKLMINGVVIAQGTVMTDRFLAMDPGNASGKVQGIDTKDPAFGIAAVWILPKDRDRAEIYGYTVVEPVAVIATHLSEVFRDQAAELVGRGELQSLLDVVAKRHPRLVDDLIPSQLTVGELHSVIRGLLRESVSVRDLRTILEALADGVRVNKATTSLVEAVRLRLGPAIAQTLVEEGKLFAALLDPEMEATLRRVTIREGNDPTLAPDFPTAQAILAGVQRAVEKLGLSNRRPILVAPADIRYALWKFVHRFLPQVVVVAQQELPPRLEVNAVAVASFERPRQPVAARG